jgi:hypothetical protein
MNALCYLPVMLKQCIVLVIKAEQSIRLLKLPFSFLILSFIFMGNQASKVLANNNNRKKKLVKRPSSTASQGNYDWLGQDPHATSNEAPPQTMGNRRKSISEFFARRKQSLANMHPTIMEEDMKEFDRLQRQVKKKKKK